MAPSWLHAVVLCRDPEALALVDVACRDRPDPKEHLRIGTPCPYCHQTVLTVVQGERGPLEVRQGLADADHCLHARLLES
jgi:hypothetical protein